MSQQSPGDPGFQFNKNYPPANWGIDPAATSFPSYSCFDPGLWYAKPTTKTFPGRKTVFMDYTYEPEMTKWNNLFSSTPPASKEMTLKELEKLYKQSRKCVSMDGGRHWSSFLEDPYNMKAIKPGGLFVSAEIRDILKSKQEAYDYQVDKYRTYDIETMLNQVPYLTKEETQLDAAKKMFSSAKMSCNQSGGRETSFSYHVSQSRGYLNNGENGKIHESRSNDGNSILTVNFPGGAPLVLHFNEKEELVNAVSCQPPLPPMPKKPHEELCMLEPVYSHAMGGYQFEAMRRKAWRESGHAYTI